MPLYEYKCNECNQVFEVMQRFSDSPLTLHEGCGGALQRLISAPALQFKGSGFYITDYSKSGGSNGSTKDAGSGKDSGAKTETKADSKPSSGTSTPPSTSGDSK